MQTHVRPMLRLPALKAAYGKGPTAIYADISAGLHTEPVKVGRCSFWPEGEIEAIQRAIIAGKSEDERRKLVGELMAARKEAA